jgi:DNA gyrase/topoisomerase IV subunit B
VGNIFGLLLSHLHLFWRELFGMGYIYRLNTPIIRAFMGKKYVNFYSKEEYQRWS